MMLAYILSLSLLSSCSRRSITDTPAAATLSLSCCCFLSIFFFACLVVAESPLQASLAVSFRWTPYVMYSSITLSCR